MVKIFALRERLEGRRAQLSQSIQEALSEVFGLPPSKRAHRFFPMDREDVFAPPDRSDDYVLIELTIIAGRAHDTKKALIKALFRNLERDLAIGPQDVEVVIVEAPPENWGFRGLCGDEAVLSYRISV